MTSDAMTTLPLDRPGSPELAPMVARTRRSTLGDTSSGRHGGRRTRPRCSANIQSVIELFDEMQIPEQMQHDFGYPAVTREIKERIFVRNLARIMGIDVEAKKAELAGASTAA
jgi:hypothetical protein